MVFTDIELLPIILHLSNSFFIGLASLRFPHFVLKSYICHEINCSKTASVLIYKPSNYTFFFLHISITGKQSDFSSLYSRRRPTRELQNCACVKFSFSLKQVLVLAVKLHI